MDDKITYVQLEVTGQLRDKLLTRSADESRSVRNYVERVLEKELDAKNGLTKPQN